jgi:hypothetical protein
MLTIAALSIKKAVTLFALAGPISMIPIFLAAAEGLNPETAVDSSPLPCQPHEYRAFHVR